MEEAYTLGFQAYPYRYQYPDNVEHESYWLRGWYDAQNKVFGDSEIFEPDGRDSWLAEY